MKIELESAFASKIGRLVSIALVSLAHLGCAYRDISPEAALADQRANSGFSELQEVEPGTAKVVLRTVGAAYPVRFSVSTSAEACESFLT